MKDLERSEKRDVWVLSLGAVAPEVRERSLSKLGLAVSAEERFGGFVRTAARIDRGSQHRLFEVPFSTGASTGFL